MKIKILLLIVLFSNVSFAQNNEKEFDYIDASVEGCDDKINKSKEYVLLVNREYKQFNESHNSLMRLKNFYFRADKIDFLNNDSTEVLGKKFSSENYQILVKTKIIGTYGIATVTYTNRTLKLNLSVINDERNQIRDSILNRIILISEEKKDTDYYAPWVIQLNRRGVFENCNEYILWDIVYNEKEAYFLYWVDHKCLKIGIASEDDRFNDNDFQLWNKENDKSKEDYLKMIKRLDYRGLYNYTQGCNYFIFGNEGGIKWKKGDCEILFECESNIESKEILEKFK